MTIAQQATDDRTRSSITAFTIGSAVAIRSMMERVDCGEAVKNTG